MNRPRVGVLGGTFDPIHNGHLAAADAAQQALGLSQVRVLPAAHPWHRRDQPQASAAHRAAMAHAALATRPSWVVSDLELDRLGPSYTFDTLTTLHDEGLPPQQVFFITGADAFAEVDTWHRYPEVLDAAHFVVIARPGFSLARLRQRLGPLSARLATATAADLVTLQTPQILLVETYTADVSSTEVRRRAACGEPLDDLVPASVAHYIEQHRLYRQEAHANEVAESRVARTHPERSHAEDNLHG